MTISAAWNTGRGYSRAGQRIAVKVLSDGRVAFYDIDRMIDGVTLNQFVDPVLGEAIDQKRLREFLMTEYDHCRYQCGLCDLDDHLELRQALGVAAKAVLHQSLGF